MRTLADVTVLVVQPDPDCPPGRVGEGLERSGVALAVRRPYAGDPVPTTMANYGGLLVLGGKMGAYDDADHPWLPSVKELLGSAVRTGTPTLGVCLGHQLLAVACGGTVRPNPAGRTAGLRPVPITGDTADDLFSDLPAAATAVHWNDDIVTLPPPDAAVLTRTADGAVQALRIGPRAWGVQFHPEVVPDVVASWARNGVAEGAMSSAAAADRLREIRAADHELAATWAAWSERFGSVVRAARRDQPAPVQAEGAGAR